MDKNSGNKTATKKSIQKKSITDKIGNAVEKIGHKIADAGFPMVGQAIHNVGDKLEKSHSNSKHPHKA